MDFLPWKLLGDGGKQTATPAPNLPPFFSKILMARGLHSPEEAQAFLHPEHTLHDPLLMRDMDRAVERIRLAIAQGQRILVYGDYDCDGVAATVMLYDYLENAGADLLYYIPQRQEEGYGLNHGAINKIKDAGVCLVITVDNGISAAPEIAAAVELGIDVIVTDHHQPPEELPVCTAILDPHRVDCDYPFKGLCGAGVAFKLISALENDTEGLLLELYGDLVALATMADIVPLLDENRFLVRAGLNTLANTQREGLLALAKIAGIELGSVTGEQISFGLAPRINVTGRIGSVDLAVELLLSQNEQEAEKLAGSINALNTQRKEIEGDIVADIGKLIHEHPEITAARVLVIAGKDWHPGVVGITAARLVERYRKPCIILTQLESGELRGSARSVEGYSIIDAIRSCEALLIKCGGHPMAAGLSLEAAKLEPFKAALEEYSKASYPTMPTSYQTVDCDLQPGDITLEHIRLLDSLQPYGCANPQPIPVLRGVTLETITPMGNGNHLRLTISQRSSRLELVYFGMDLAGFPIPVGTVVDCAVALSVNCYKEVERPSIRVVSLVPVGFPMEAKLRGVALYEGFRRGEGCSPEEQGHCMFSREALSTAFRLLRELSPYSGGVDWLLCRLGADFGYFRLMVALDILTELALISVTRKNGHTVYTVLPAAGKANIPDAPTYKQLAAEKLI